MIVSAVALILAAVSLGLLYLVFQEQKAEAQRSLEVANALQVIDQRLDGADSRIAATASELKVLSDHVGLTETELKRAKALAEQLKTEQQHNVQALNQKIEAKADTTQVENLKQQANTKIKGVSDDLEQVKQDVTSNQTELQKAVQDLARLGVKVTEQGNMIATSAQGLEELRRRGEKDYATFDVRKKQRLSVGGVGVELRKADTKKQYADLRLYVDDRRMDNNKIYVNRPITFYAGRGRIPYELVINQVKKDEIVGYISVPKGKLPAGGPAFK